MELRDYIELGVQKTPGKTIKELAELVGMKRENLSATKNHRASMPEEAIWKLAKLIQVNPANIVAAQQFALAKTDAKREFWRPFVEHARAACMLIALGVVTNFVTPSPAMASTTGQNYDGIQVVKIMRSLRRSARKLVRILTASFQPLYCH